MVLRVNLNSTSILSSFMLLIPLWHQHLLPLNYFQKIEHFPHVPCPKLSILHCLESHFQIFVKYCQLSLKIQCRDLDALTRQNCSPHLLDNLQPEMSPRSGRTPIAANILPYVIGHYYCYPLRPVDNNSHYSHFSTAHLGSQNSPFSFYF